MFLPRSPVRPFSRRPFCIQTRPGALRVRQAYFNITFRGHFSLGGPHGHPKTFPGFIGRFFEI